MLNNIITGPVTIKMTLKENFQTIPHLPEHPYLQIPPLLLTLLLKTQHLQVRQSEPAYYQNWQKKENFSSHRTEEIHHYHHPLGKPTKMICMSINNI